MFSDWQTIIVCLIILGALSYVGRRGWRRVRSFGAGGRGEGAAASCASGCGSCGDGRQAMGASGAKTQSVLVQINSGRSATGSTRKS